MQISTERHALAAAGLAAALAFSTGAHAFQDAGDKEVEFTGGFSHTSGSNVGTVNADASLGYYVAPRFDVGIRQTLNYNFVDEGGDTWTASTIPFANYYFGTANQNFRPFIGAFLGAAYTTDDITGTIGPAAGFKYFLTDNTAVVARYRYEWYFDDLTFDDALDTADGNHIVTVGMSFLWK
jgi:outer membrane protein W